MDREGKKERDLFTIKKARPIKKSSKRRIVFESSDDEEQSKSKKPKDSDDYSVRIEPLSYQSLMSGLVTLGCISEVTNYELIVSLPFMMYGRVPITRISQAYTSLLKKVTETKEESSDAEDQVFTLQSLFKQGQYLVTKVESVEKTEKNHKVHLCLMPHEVNFGIGASKLKAGVVLPCAVASIEDNGYVMETGIPDVRVAFLNRAKAEGSGIVGVGSVVRCLVTQVKSSDDGRTVQMKLSAIPKDVNKAFFDVTETDDFSLLLPGTAVTTTIATIEKDNMKLIMAETDGVVSSYHLQTPLHQLKRYQISQRIKARVLYITPLSRVVHLTLQHSIFSESPVEGILHGHNIGDRKQGEVYEVQKRGIFLKLGDCRAFCPRKHLRDKENTKEDNNLLNFPIGSEHMLRIMSYHHFDQTFAVSLQKSVMDAQIVGFCAVKVGQVLKATIKKYETHGAVVSVATNVDGQIPLLHLTDTVVKHPEKKYAIGNTVIVRVLEVVPERKHLILTCKKLLVNSKEAVVSEYSKDLVNTVARGFIVKIDSMGLLVAFYNGVKGFVPKSKASTEKVDDLSTIFSLGNVVKCTILLVKPEEKRMTLSLTEGKVKPEEKRMTLSLTEGKAKSESNTANNKKKKGTKELKVRNMVNCVVKNVDKASVKVRIKPSNLKAEIPVSHLADDAKRCKALKEILCSGDQIHNIALFRIADNITLSMKDSVCSWIQKSKSGDHEQLKKSSSYPAVISEILPSGLMVTIPVGSHGQSALVQPRQTEDENPVEDLTNVGHTIQVKCMGFDDQDHPILSIQGKNQKMNKRKYLQLLYNHLRYESVLQLGLLRKGLLSKEFGEIQIGNKLEVEVVAVTSLGLLVKNESGSICGIILNEHRPLDTKHEVGDRLLSCVLHVHLKERCVVLTGKPDLVEQLHFKENPQIKLEQKVKCEVLFIQKEFILVRLTSRCKGLMAYVPFKRNLNVGQNVTITVKYIEDKFVFGITKAQSKWKLESICPEIPSIHLWFTDDDHDKEVEHMDVDGEEESAVKKMKKIVFCSNVKKEVISMDQVESGKTTKKKKCVSDKEETLVNQGKSKKKGSKKKNVDSKKANQKKCDVKKEEVDSGVDENMDLDVELPKCSKSSKPCLKVGTGFVWDVPENECVEDDDSSGNEEDKEEEAKKKKTKRLTKVEREILAKEEEKRLHDLECARLEKGRLPQSALDYEELLQQSPNSSAIWIQFISFYLENAEVDQARSISQRALQQISVEEYEERINVWTVVLRLEVLYGTEESTEAAFREALATNDPLKIYMAMAMVYAESNKLKEAEDLYFKMSKKFSSTFDVWIKAGIFFFKNNKLEEARSYMDRALLSLDKTHHVNLINRFGQLEFQFGEVERARTMFESLLSNYPKRMDIWIVYVDLLAKRGDIEGARQVLERMTSLKLRLRNMRSVFKKFLEFEKIHGTPQSVESVKNRVQDYVAASLQQD